MKEKFSKKLKIISKIFQKFFANFCGKLLFLKKNRKKIKMDRLHIVLIFWLDTIYSIFRAFEKEIEKILKKFKKLLKKVLTNGNIYDILHERSTEERKNNGP